MLRNFFKTAYRNILRNKFLSLINLFCIVIGMTSFLILMNYFFFETSYDSFQDNNENLYRISTIIQGTSSNTQEKLATIPASVAPTLASAFPEIKDFVRVRIPGPNSGRNLVSYQEKKFLEDEVAFVDNSFFEVFSFPLLKGDFNSVLDQPYSIVLSESYAKKYFGNKNPLNEVLLFKSKQKKYNCKVTGVFKDMPANSHMSFDMLISMDTYFPVYDKEWQREDWDLHDFFGYLLLDSNTSFEQLQAKFPEYLEDRNPFDKRQENIDIKFVLQPLAKIHLDTPADLKWDYAKVGNKLSVYSLLFISIVLLISAWINYINLTSARALERAKEVGIRKILGSKRSQLMALFFIESLIINIVALVISIILYFILNTLYGVYTQNNIPLSIFENLVPCLLVFLIIILGILLSSWLPSFLISSYNPSDVIKSSKITPKGVTLRKSLVVIQLIFSSIFIIGTLIALSQLRFLSERSLGFEMDNTLVIEEPMTLKDSLYYRSVSQFIDEIETSSTIGEVGTSTDVPGLEIGWADLFSLDNSQERYTISDSWVNFDFFDVYGIKLVSGRDFSRDFLADAQQSVIINQAALKLLNIQSAEEALTHTLRQTHGNKFRIIGVIENYHQESPIKQYAPTIYFLDIKEKMSHLSVKLNSNSLNRDLTYIEEKWTKIFPDIPINYFFLDEYYNRQYIEDRSFSKSLGLFALITIIIASLGLLGISYSNILDQNKEIAIRKVIGASVTSLVMHLLKDFLKMILIANIIAWPIAYYVMNEWLNNYANRINMSIWVFVGSGMLIISIMFLVIGYQTFKAVVKNPIDALRNA